MKIRIERISDDVLKIHRLYGEGVSENEITRPHPDKLISLLPFEKLEAHLRRDSSMIVDVSNPVVTPRSTYSRLAKPAEDSYA